MLISRNRFQRWRSHENLAVINEILAVVYEILAAIYETLAATYETLTDMIFYYCCRHLLLIR